MVSPVRGLIRIFGRMTKLSLQMATLLAVCWGGGFGVSAQTQEPDYSNVDDILNGRRTLVAVDDLVIAGYQSGDLTTFTLTTTDSHLNPATSISEPLGITSGLKIFTGYMFNLSSATTVELLTGYGIPGTQGLYVPFLGLSQPIILLPTTTPAWLPQAPWLTSIKTAMTI